MDGVELCAQDFADTVQMVQVGAAEILTGVAGAAFINRTLVEFVFGVFDFQIAKTGKQPAVTRIAGRHDAVEHIHAVCHAVYQVFRRADAHQIMWLVFRQDRADGAQHTVHFGLRFANRQAADGQAGEVEFFQTFQRLFAQIFIHRALYNTKQRIWVFQVFKSLFAAFRPAQAHLQRFLRLAVRCFARGAFV